MQLDKHAQRPPSEVIKPDSRSEVGARDELVWTFTHNKEVVCRFGESCLAIKETQGEGHHSDDGFRFAGEFRFLVFLTCYLDFLCKTTTQNELQTPWHLRTGQQKEGGDWPAPVLWWVESLVDRAASGGSPTVVSGSLRDVFAPQWTSSCCFRSVRARV